MEPSKILPDLQCSLLCEDVRQESSGNFILVGVASMVRVPRIPITALKLCIFNRWTAGIGSFQENVRFIGADQTTVLRKSQVRFELKDPSANATNVSVFAQIQFETAGVYHFEVLVDDVMKLRFPVAVALVPSQKRGTKGAGNPQPPPPDPPPA